MTQNNEREAVNSIEFNDIALKQQSEAWQAVCCALDEVKPNWMSSNLPAMECAVNAIKELTQSPISQNEQQTKQIPDGWKPIETVPKDGTQVIIKCSGGRVATAFYDDKQFVGEGWHVVVPFLGGFGSGTDTFIYFQEDMPTHWMPLPPAPTNTEVWE